MKDEGQNKENCIMSDLKTERAPMHYSLRNMAGAGGFSRIDEQMRFKESGLVPDRFLGV